jgi:hypothetical protein
MLVLTTCLEVSFLTAALQVFNPLDTPLQIVFVQADSGINGEIYARFGQAFDNFIIPPHGTANSGVVNNVVLIKGFLASLGLVGHNLDVSVAATAR